MSEGERGGGAESGALFLPGAELNNERSGKKLHFTPQKVSAAGGVHWLQGKMGGASKLSKRRPLVAALTSRNRQSWLQKD